MFAARSSQALRAGARVAAALASSTIIPAAVLALGIALASPAPSHAQSWESVSAPPKLSEETEKWIDSTAAAVKSATDALSRLLSAPQPNPTEIARQMERISQLIKHIRSDSYIQRHAALNALLTDDNAALYQHLNLHLGLIEKDTPIDSAEIEAMKREDDEASRKYRARVNAFSAQIRQELDARLGWAAPTDSKHYDDAHSFGWDRKPVEAPTPPDAPTRHYDDAHNFGWPNKPVEKQADKGESGAGDRNTSPPAEKPRKPVDERPAQPQPGHTRLNRDARMPNDRGARQIVASRGGTSSVTNPVNRTAAHVVSLAKGALRNDAGMTTNGMHGARMGGMRTGGPGATQGGGMHMGGMGGMGSMHMGVARR